MEWNQIQFLLRCCYILSSISFSLSFWSHLTFRSEPTLDESWATFLPPEQGTFSCLIRQFIKHTHIDRFLSYNSHCLSSFNWLFFQGTYWWPVDINLFLPWFSWIRKKKTKTKKESVPNSSYEIKNLCYFPGPINSTRVKVSHPPPSCIKMHLMPFWEARLYLHLFLKYMPTFLSQICHWVAHHSHVYWSWHRPCDWYSWLLLPTIVPNSAPVTCAE